MIDPDTIVPVHLVTLVITLIGIFLADHQAFNWMRGKTEVMEEAKVRRYHTWVGYGLTGMVVTGLAMFYLVSDKLIGNPTFYIKMSFVAVLTINAFAIGRFMPVAFTRSFKSLTARERAPLLISGALSTVSWLGAIVCAFFLLP